MNFKLPFSGYDFNLLNRSMHIYFHVYILFFLSITITLTSIAVKIRGGIRSETILKDGFSFVSLKEMIIL